MSLLHSHLTPKQELTAIDRIINVAAVVYPLMGVPQIIDIFVHHRTDGVSVISWLGFAVFAAIFLVYGLAHRLRPVIITQVLWLVVDIAIVLGVLIYGQ